MRTLAKFALPILVLLQGCSSAVVGDERKVSVSTSNGIHAECKLENPNGESVVAHTPGAAFVRGSVKNLVVTCDAPGWHGQTVVAPVLEETTLGNLGNFGPIGFLGDWMSGGITRYETNVVVTMLPN